MARFDRNRLARGVIHVSDDVVAELARDYDGDPVTEAQRAAVFVVFGPGTDRSLSPKGYEHL